MTSLKVSMLGVPMDLGAGRRGTDMGPSALRLAGLGPAIVRLGHELDDLGNVEVPVMESGGSGDPRARYAAQIRAACMTAFHTLTALPEGTFPLVLGGDHSVALASVAAAFRGPAPAGGLIWVDAHADLNTPSTSPSGNIHGMPVAHLLGMGSRWLREIWGDGRVLEPDRIVYIGLRSLDAPERELIGDLGIRAYSMTDIDRLGIARVMQETQDHLDGAGTWHLSLDADVLDPAVAPGVGTPVPGGLTYREAHYLMESLSASGRVRSADLVEVNPIIDSRNQTAVQLTGLAESLFGKAIL